MRIKPLGVKQNNMKELIKDLEAFGKKHWKRTLSALVVAFLIWNYSDIKSGIIDGWLNK